MHCAGASRLMRARVPVRWGRAFPALVPGPTGLRLRKRTGYAYSSASVAPTSPVGRLCSREGQALALAAYPYQPLQHPSLAMNKYPPGNYISDAMRTLPPPGPDLPLQTVEIDAGHLWGRYQVTFLPKLNPRRGMRTWFWVMESGERIDSPSP